MEIAALVDSEVVAARFDSARRELTISTEKGTARYSRVTAIGATLGARIAAAEWVQDALPQTILSERVAGVEKAEAPRGLAWLHGDAAGFEGAAVRDALGFTGGRWYRLFVGAGSARVEAAAGGA